MEVPRQDTRTLPELLRHPDDRVLRDALLLSLTFTAGWMDAIVPAAIVTVSAISLIKSVFEQESAWECRSCRRSRGSSVMEPRSPPAPSSRIRNAISLMPTVMRLITHRISLITSVSQQDPAWNLAHADRHELHPVANLAHDGRHPCCNACAFSLMTCLFCFMPHGMKLVRGLMHHDDRRAPAHDVLDAPHDLRHVAHELRDAPV
jgi:hypothetical protein